MDDSYNQYPDYKAIFQDEAAHELHEALGALLAGLMLWMVGWRDDLKPEARAQMEAMIGEYGKIRARY